MKVLLVLATSLILPSAFAGTIHCGNPPARVWGEYFCLYASFKDGDGSEMTDVHYGVCSGSTAAEEEEESETVSFSSVKHNDALRATSAQWKKANAYDLSSRELGKATAYISAKSFKKSGDGVMRLKAKLNGVQKDVKLDCVIQLED